MMSVDAMRKLGKRNTQTLSLLNQLDYAANCVYDAYETLNDTGDTDSEKLDKCCRMSQDLIALIDSVYQDIDNRKITV